MGVADFRLNGLSLFVRVGRVTKQPDCVFTLNAKTLQPSKSRSILDNWPRMDADPAAQPLRAAEPLNAWRVNAGTGMAGGTTTRRA